MPSALAALEKGGTLALAGNHISLIPLLNYEQTLFCDLNVRLVAANTCMYDQKLLVEAAQVPIRPRITCYSLVEANLALQDLQHDRINGTGILLMHD